MIGYATSFYIIYFICFSISFWLPILNISLISYLLFSTFIYFYFLIHFYLILLLILFYQILFMRSSFPSSCSFSLSFSFPSFSFFRPFSLYPSPSFSLSLSFSLSIPLPLPPSAFSFDSSFHNFFLYLHLYFPPICISLILNSCNFTIFFVLTSILSFSYFSSLSILYFQRCGCN